MRPQQATGSVSAGKERKTMNIYTDIVLFSLIIIVYWVITELFTILFRFTGIPDEKARFQVISLLTGTGFTTRESELLLTNRVRRRLARATMLFGYAFNITIVSAFINVFLTLKLSQVKNYYIGVLAPLSVGIVVFTVMRIPRVRGWWDRFLQKVADRLVGRTDSVNTVLLLDYISGDSIAVVTLKRVPESMQGIPLSETGLRSNTGILIMLVEHNGQKAVPARADTVFVVGDKLTVFGNYAVICKTFHAREHFADDR